MTVGLSGLPRSWPQWHLWLRLHLAHGGWGAVSANLEGQAFFHRPLLHFVSLGCNHLGSTSFSLVECSPPTPLSEALACYLLVVRPLSEGRTAFLVAHMENHWPFPKRGWHYFRLDRRGRGGEEVDHKCGGWYPMVTNFILSSDSLFQGALTLKPLRESGWFCFFFAFLLYTLPAQPE